MPGRHFWEISEGEKHLEVEAGLGEEKGLLSSLSPQSTAMAPEGRVGAKGQPWAGTAGAVGGVCLQGQLTNLHLPNLTASSQVMGRGGMG